LRFLRVCRVVAVKSLSGIIHGGFWNGSVTYRSCANGSSVRRCDSHV
jgi:hypothetical protein